MRGRICKKIPEIMAMVGDMERKGRGAKGVTPNMCLSDQGNCTKR